MRLSILWRLGLSFFVLILLAYILGFKGVSSMENLQEETENIYEHPFVFAKNSRDIHVHIQEISLSLLEVLDLNTTANLVDIETEVNLIIEEIKKHHMQLDKAIIGEKVSYAAYLATFENFQKNEKKFFGLLKLGYKEEAKKVYDKKYMKYERRLLLNIIALEEHADANAKILHEKSASYLQNALYEFKIILAIVTLLGILFILFAFYHFIRPIRKFQMLIQNIALGDTSHKIFGLQRKDELGDIARSIALLNERLETITLHTDKIAHGNLSAKLSLSSEKDNLVKSIQIMTQNLKDSFMKNQKYNWIQSGKEHLSIILRENENKQSLGDRILIVLAEYTSAEIGTLYLCRDDKLYLENSYAYINNKNETNVFVVGEGLLGQAALKDSVSLISNIPKTYIQVKSGLGKSTPNCLVIIPFFYKGKLKGVIELGYFTNVENKVIKFMENIRESLGIAYESIDSRIALNDAFLEEQATAEELQAQEEELRVSNEKLLEQSEVLQSQKTYLEKTSSDLSQKAVELEQASKYKSEFLANMSHELRTPLNSLLLLSRSLANNDEKHLDSNEVESAEVIYESGEHLLSLINDILDISKVEAGQMILHEDSVETDDFMGLIRNRFTHMAEEKDIYFKINVSDEFPEVFIADSKKIEQIMTNLIANALKFTTKGGVTLALEMRDAHLYFKIKDTGIGIPKEKQAVIFEAFRQADGSTSRNFGGTGLGLSIAMSFSKLMGVRIELESEVDKGSVFTIVLPFSQNATLIKKTFKELHETAPSFEDDREKLDENKTLFLIIEDDEKFAKILYKHCHEHNDQAIVAQDGETGVLLAKRYDVQGIILDYMLPKMDGLEVLEFLKADSDTKNIPVHVMSALNNLADMKKLGAIGQNAKPVSTSQINNVLDSFSLNDNIDKIGIFTNQVKEKEHLPLDTSHKNLEGKKILLVDDDMRNTYSLAKIFRGEKLEVFIASSGAKALEVLSENQDIDMILMDIMMPKMDGYEVNRAIREIENYKETPIIAVTANAMIGDKEKCLESGANDYMSKPIDIEKLFVMMQIWL